MSIIRLFTGTNVQGSRLQNIDCRINPSEIISNWNGTGERLAAP